MKKNIILIVTLLVIAGAIYALDFSRSNTPVIDADIKIIQPVASKARLPKAKEIVNPSAFINTQPIQVADVVGKKVILVDFWTYSCINCQRTTPYLNAWYEKYKDKGLEIFGVHTPEFDFEKKTENVEKATEKMGIEYPVIQDNDYATWRAYGNRYWPRKYLIDIDGYIIYDHIGEGGYSETEQKIREALAERAEKLGQQIDLGEPVIKAEPEKTETVRNLSPETYFGALRNDRLANGIKGSKGLQVLKAPETPELHQLYLVGSWNIEDEYAKNETEEDRILFRYFAKDVFMVASDDAGVEIEVLRDGKPLGAAKGKDLDEKGHVKIKEDRLYHLISEPDIAGDHTLQIRVLSPGLKAFTFTFGE